MKNKPRLGDTVVKEGSHTVTLCQATYKRGDKYKKFCGFINSEIERKSTKIYQYSKTPKGNQWIVVSKGLNYGEVFAQANSELKIKINKNKDYVPFGKILVLHKGQRLDAEPTGPTKKKSRRIYGKQ